MPDMSSPAALLSVRGLATRAGERTLQTDLDLELAAGEIIAVQGPSGCGKTTLLRTLACLQDPAAGEVRSRGRTPDQIGWPGWRRQVVLVAQVPAVFPGSVGENLARPFRYRGADGPFPSARARRLLDQVLLKDVDLAVSAERLSVGQQQRIVTVRALLLEPAVLLLDEPASALDARAAASLFALIRAEIKARDGAALVVTHAAGPGGRWFDRRLELTSLGAASRALAERDRP